jgi:hypothetical protein
MRKCFVLLLCLLGFVKIKGGTMQNIKNITTVSIVVATLCLISLIGAQVKESKIELIPVYEKTFDDTIADAIFDTLTVSIEEAKEMGWKEEWFAERAKSGGNVVILYPKVIFIGRHKDVIKEMVFYTKDGAIIKRVSVIPEIEEVIQSENGRDILKAKKYDEFDKSKQGAILYDWDGNVIWEKSNGIFTAVSDEGYTATGFGGADGSSYPFEIYNLSGVKILGEGELGISAFELFNSAGKFSRGFYLVGSGGSRESEIFVFSLPDGKRLIAKKLSGYVWLPELKVLSRNTLVYSLRNVGPDTLIFLDLEGKVKWRVSPTFNLVGDADYYLPDVKDDLMYVYTTTGNLLLIEKGKLKWEVKLEKGLKIFEGYGVQLSNKEIQFFSLRRFK